MTKIEAAAYLRDQVPPGSTLTIVPGKHTRRQYHVVQVYKGTQDLSPWIAYWLERQPIGAGLKLGREESIAVILCSLSVALFGEDEGIGFKVQTV